jgi:hypothetical protein
MGKVAERLDTSHPNVSRSIAALEHALGVCCSIAINRGSSRPIAVVRRWIAEWLCLGAE